MKTMYMATVAAVLTVCTANGQCGGGSKASPGGCALADMVAGCGADSSMAGCATADAAAEAPKGIAEIDTDALKVLVNAKAATILDARSGKWDDGERIPGGVSLAVGTGTADVEKIVGSKNSLVVTYCSSLQCPASHKLATYLRELGYENVIEYPKGIAGWKAAGNEVEKIKK